MVKNFRILMMAALLIGFSAGNVLAETMWAKKDRVKVTAEKSPTSSVVAILRVGDQVQVLQKSGRLYKVKLRNGKSGWVFKFKLSDTQPEQASGGSGLSGLAGDNTVVAQEARAGGSIRGLKETSEQYADKKNISQADRRSVEKMEQRTVTDDEFNQFKKDGRIGEYAGGVS
ncbi:MAG: SH3 domain-containing protein [Nitrospirales bacterium]|nr:SH3 domain-containing protein [Nitrospirales bacterium]